MAGCVVTLLRWQGFVDDLSVGNPTFGATMLPSVTL